MEYFSPFHHRHLYVLKTKHCGSIKHVLGHYNIVFEKIIEKNLTALRVLYPIYELQAPNTRIFSACFVDFQWNPPLGRKYSALTNVQGRTKCLKWQKMLDINVLLQPPRCIGRMVADYSTLRLIAQSLT